MQPRLSIVGILIVILSAGFVHGSLIMDTASHQHPTGCHEHGSKPIPAAPADFHCCQAGHDTPILLPSWTAQAALDAREFVTPELPPFATALAGFPAQVHISTDPPGLTPLRI